jgi:hypothetical protein
MRIGILACLFNCAANLESVLRPWFDLKLRGPGVELKIAAVSGMFKEYAELGYEQDALDIETARELLRHEKYPFDYLSLINNPHSITDKSQLRFFSEAETRDFALRYLLAEKVDLLWLLDGDEIYEEAQIESIISYIRKNEPADWYSINFKNYIFDGKVWIDGFHPPRVFRTDRGQGIRKFYSDNVILYCDGRRSVELMGLIIPEEIAHIKHLTWLDTDGRKKYEYQMRHFGECSYVWNYKENKLEFNEEYYKKYEQQLPRLNYDSSQPEQDDVENNDGPSYSDSTTGPSG